ncbi:TetR/AcrR family transcriptional regulator [Corynebacterium frankenforstense]|uniref:TetR/AcrR family transcriptional regulator n=1 Tax=Corynebacterium frankenforstense TaxID=1230998 RepID=UPI0009520302|nr:TetR/AcrR family transcriptional regulator [Corynebacterium frankenforstense]
MAGLWETKKAATRAAIIESAARILFERGTEALTVAAIAEEAGVSPRTFHNYFSSREDALLEYVVGQVTLLIDELRGAPKDQPLLAALEEATVCGLTAREGEPGPLSAIVRVSEVLNFSLPEDARVRVREQVEQPLLALVAERDPELPELEARVLIGAAGAAAGAAAHTYTDLIEAGKPADPKQLVRRAFAMLGSIPV